MSVINSKVNNKPLCVIYTEINNTVYIQNIAVDTLIINLKYILADIDDYEECEMPKWVMNMNLQCASVKLRILQLYASR